MSDDQETGNKRGRRKREKGGVDNISPAHPAFNQTSKRIQQRLEIDPTGSNALASIFDPVINRKGSNVSKKLAGFILADMIENAPIPIVEESFALIIEMMKNRQAADKGDVHRNAFALIAWRDFSEEYGFSPKKRRLKSYILASPKRYRNMPDKGDTKGWTRIWEDSGLRELES